MIAFMLKWNLHSVLQSYYGYVFIAPITQDKSQDWIKLKILSTLSPNPTQALLEPDPKSFPDL